MNDDSLNVNGADLVADLSGALLWPERRLLAVADLHLEKGSGYARHGQFLPPYDSAATIDRLEDLLDRTRPDTVMCLGDSFHDRGAEARLPAAEAARLRALVARADWVWITGNHDPEPPLGLGGRAAAEVEAGPLRFRHEGRPGSAGDVSGHHHPAAAVRVRGRRVRARCFAHDGRRVILPAFGAYAGGLNVLDPAFRPLLGTRFAVHLLGRGRVYAFPSARLEPDAASPAPTPRPSPAP